MSTALFRELFLLTINDGSAANGGSIIFGTQASTYSGGTVINGGVVNWEPAQVWAPGSSRTTEAPCPFRAGTTINNSLTSMAHP